VPDSSAVQRLLDELCVRLGFCLPPDAQERLVRDPPADATAFTDAVLAAEGLDPSLAPRALYRQVRSLVRETLRGPQ
jgi:hypothetical protein